MPEKDVVETIELGQSFPNPMSSESKVIYSIPSHYHGASMSLYDQYGRRILNLPMETGIEKTLELDLTAFTSGTYYYCIEFFGTKLASRKLVLIK
jgi:hypothetical protein